jgi:cytoskeletal protein CcmA (bactofilin family)
MDGNAYCRESIHLATTAKLNGNIETASLVIDDGAVFTGTSFMNTNFKSNGDRAQRQASGKEANNKETNTKEAYKETPKEAV